MQSAAPVPHPTPASEAVVPQPRTIVLCFDGTGNMFGENSNVIRFCQALVKDKPDRQIVYYQPGIGTYNERQFFTKSVSTAASMFDKCIALNLDHHVKEGYQFIMKNYRQGDKICLFGFSRGAHTARVVSGMLYKVGLLPPHNDQQVDFAFSVYESTGSHGVQLSKEFKKTFAIPVTVEFVGVWDTVSSVGIIPKSYPYTSVNYAVKTFRHALALDERRARFRPQTWNEPTEEREQELDVDDPRLILKPRDKSSRDEWVYQPPERTTTDVKEVWFAGAHADVGGGSHPNTEQDSLSFIPLRWMIKECLIKGTGILFDPHVLSSFDFDFAELDRSLKQELSGRGLTLHEFGFSDHEGNIGDIHPQGPASNSSLNGSPPNGSPPNGSSPNGAVVHQPPSLSLLPPQVSTSPPLFEIGSFLSKLYPVALRIKDLNPVLKHAKDATDCIAKVFDQLDIAKGWWFLELLPTITTYQNPDGSWVRIRTRNFGQGRYIPFSSDRIFVHKSVEDKIGSKEYKPKAFNWDMVVASEMLEYVH